jgi:hypothetical protein
MYALGQKQYLACGHRGIIAYGIDKYVVQGEYAYKRKGGKKDVDKNIEQNIGGGQAAFHLEYGLLSD